MRIAYDNILNYATSLTATNEKANRSIANIIHPYLEKVFEAENGSPIQSDVVAIFSEPQESNCVVFGNHNITTGNIVFRDEFDVSLGNIILIPSIFFPGNRILEFPLIQGIYKIEATLVNTIGTILYAGSLFFSKYLEMPRFNQGPQFSISLRSTSFKSGSGQASGNASVNLRNDPFAWTDVDYEKINEVNEYLEFVQTSKPHWIDPYPDLDETQIQPDEKSLKYPIRYVTIAGNEIPQPKRSLRDWKYNLSIQYEEAR